MSSNDRMQQLVDEPPAENRRPEPAFDLVHVVARLQHADDRRVGARPADAVLFERLDERPFVEARRRLRELLLGRDALHVERLPFGQHRQHAARRLVVRVAGGTAGRRRRLLGPLALLGFAGALP